MVGHLCQTRLGREIGRILLSRRICFWVCPWIVDLLGILSGKYGSEFLSQDIAWVIHSGEAGWITQEREVNINLKMHRQQP
jgi:hypothetical protein